VLTIKRSNANAIQFDRLGRFGNDDFFAGNPRLKYLRENGFGDNPTDGKMSKSGNQVKAGVDHAQARNWLVDALRECSAAARPHNIRLALEPNNRYETTLINTTAQGLELIENVGAANFGLLLDTFHMNIEEPVIEESIHWCENKIFHFHVADSNRWYPGAGHLDFKSIVKSLVDTGYTGWVSGEFLPNPDARIAAQKSVLICRKYSGFFMKMYKQKTW